MNIDGSNNRENCGEMNKIANYALGEEPVQELKSSK